MSGTSEYHRTEPNHVLAYTSHHSNRHVYVIDYRKKERVIPSLSHRVTSVFSLTQLTQCCPQRSVREGELNTCLTWLGIVPATTRGSGSPGGLTNHSAMAQLSSVGHNVRSPYPKGPNKRIISFSSYNNVAK